jgi:hypothetical protein
LEYDLPTEFIDAAYIKKDLKKVKEFFKCGLTLKNSLTGARLLFESLRISKNKEFALLLVENGLDPYFFQDRIPYEIEDDILVYRQDWGDLGCRETPYPDTDFLEILIAMGADLNAIRLNTCQTGLDIVLSQKYANDEYAHPQALKLLQELGAKCARELTREQWLQRMSFADLCKQGLLEEVKLYLSHKPVLHPEYLQTLFCNFTAWKNIEWWGNHPDRDFEGVFTLLFTLGISLQDMRYSFAQFFSVYFDALMQWAQKTRCERLPVYYWYGKPFPPAPLQDVYFPVFSLSYFLSLLLEQGCEINFIHRTQLLTALDYVLQTQSRAQKELNQIKKNTLPESFAQINPEYKEDVYKELEMRQERLQRVLRESEEALAFLIAHGAKTYAELSA